MLTDKHINVLKFIYEKLSVTDVNWVVTGSTAFIIEGFFFKPNDIDIQTDRYGAYKIEEYLKEFQKKKVEFSSTNIMRSHFGAFEIDGIKVEVMGDIEKYVNGVWEESVDLKKYKRVVEFKDMNIPVLDLEYEYEAYMKIGRKEKANILKERIYEKKYLNNIK